MVTYHLDGGGTISYQGDKWLPITSRGPNEQNAQGIVTYHRGRDKWLHVTLMGRNG